MLVALAACGESASDPAAESASIVGTILNPADEPLEGVLVHMGRRRALTDASGRFEIGGLDPAVDRTLAIDGETVRAHDGRPYLRVSHVFAPTPGQRLELEDPIVLVPVNPPVMIAGALDQDPADPRIGTARVPISVSPPGAEGFVLRFEAGTRFFFPGSSPFGAISVTPMDPSHAPFLPGGEFAQAFAIGPTGLRVAEPEGIERGRWLAFANELEAEAGERLMLGRMDAAGRFVDVGAATVADMDGVSLLAPAMLETPVPVTPPPPPGATFLSWGDIEGGLQSAASATGIDWSKDAGSAVNQVGSWGQTGVNAVGNFGGQVAGELYSVRCLGGTISGRVLSESRRPAQGVSVELRSVSGWLTSGTVKRTTTDALGWYRFNGGVCSFEIWAKGAFTKAATRRGSGSSGSAIVPDLVLVPERYPYTLHATVLDALGRPWPGIEVLVRTPSGFSTGLRRSDGRGGYRFQVQARFPEAVLTVAPYNGCLLPSLSWALWPHGWPFNVLAGTLRHGRTFVQRAPVLTQLNPSTIDPRRLSVVQVRGLKLAPDARVEIGGVVAERAGYGCSADQEVLTVWLPSRAQGLGGGAYPVRVVNPDGQASNTLTLTVDRPLELMSIQAENRVVDPFDPHYLLTTSRPRPAVAWVGNARAQVFVVSNAGFCLPARQGSSPEAFVFDIGGTSFGRAGVFTLAVADGCRPDGTPIGRVSRPEIVGVTNPRPELAATDPVTPRIWSYAMRQAGFTVTVRGRNFVAATALEVNAWRLPVTPAEVADDRLVFRIPPGLIEDRHLGESDVRVATRDERGSRLASATTRIVVLRPEQDCTFMNGLCGPDAVCTMSAPTERTCACKPGLMGDGRTCVDINECAANNGGCDPNATCINLPGSAECHCKAGFAGNGLMCADVDECATGNGGCSPNAACTNTPGSFTCACRPGYMGDGRTCVDIDECQMGNGACSPSALCTNTPGGRTCACKPGFAGDGVVCNQLDPCLMGNGGCHVNAVCGFAAGTRTCTCKPGFAGDGITCADVDECAMANGGCSPNAICTNTAGGRACMCKPGFMGDGTSCLDVNECATNNGGCHANATCTNSAGGRTCACKPGFAGDGTSCLDVDECATGNGGCHANATCTNLPGGHTCACKPGYAGNGLTCTDVNECAINNGGCSANADCLNMPGSRVCLCRPGYIGDGVTCNDVDECALGGTGCHVDASCVNTPGAFMCVCNPGFTGNGLSCTDVNECAINNGGCSPQATCANTPGGRACTCISGYTGDGVVCTDVNECAMSNGGCSVYATCTNTAGGRICTCNAPYMGNGITCTLE